MLRGLLLAAALCGSSSSSSSQMLELTDDTLQAALDEHSLLLLSVRVPECDECDLLERKIKAAGKELRVKAAGAVTLASMTIVSQDSPILSNIVQGQLTIPKLLIFRDGEALDFVGETTKKGIVAEMLRQVGRESIQTLKTVKQTERFLHLDSWSTMHADEEKPPRVVGFFPSNGTAGYAVFRATAGKLQGMIGFGACFDAALQKKFLGAPARKTLVQVVKADKKERKLEYGGPLAVGPLARWVATHSLSLVQDLTTESSIESHMARGVPVFLLLMPDSYEDSLSVTIKAFRAVASRVREKLLFAYGFKDTEPWPQFAQSLGIGPGSGHEQTGAFWIVVGNGMEITGRNWTTAWLRPPALGFQIYAMEAHGERDVTEDKLSAFVDGFLEQVEAMEPAVTSVKGVEGVVEEEVDIALPGTAAGASGGGGAVDAAAAANYDKELRKLVAALEMSFNSGVANLKKALDDTKDAPHLLPGRTAGMTTALSATELKVKKGMLDLKRKLMDIGKKKDEL